MNKPSKSQWLSILFAMVGFVSWSNALQQKERAVVPEYRDEGDSAVMFSTSCVSSSWSVMIATDSIRRAIIYQTDETAASTVCLSTTTNSGDTCSASTPGPKILVGGNLTDYSGVGFLCRSKSGTVSISGYWTRDTGDAGSANRPR